MRVLVVEDEAMLAEALATGLRADGFTVEVTGDGLDGLARAQRNGYDAVVLDIMLPGISGLRWCAECVDPGCGHRC